MNLGAVCIQAGGVADAWLQQVRFLRRHRVAERGDAAFPLDTKQIFICLADFI